ncbi:MAG: hypothetical protein J6A51_00840 [Clostridia bacterium]|nr:hypothetical protein [Clostridia bacterium]
MKKEKKFKQKRKAWYRGLKNIMKCRYKKPEFIFLGEKPTKSSIILSNHEGTDAPMSLEIYCDFPIRMWGTAEMNSGLKRLYAYQTKVYYHEKKHWNLTLARMFCLLASPLTNLFYKGLNLISTYKDGRLKTTIKESLDAIQNGENIVIFPENSEDGYLPELKGFFNGFILLAEQCEKRGIDIPIYVSYFRIKEKVYVFDRPLLFSEIKKQCKTRNEIAAYLVGRCNALGKIDLDKVRVK